MGYQIRHMCAWMGKLDEGVDISVETDPKNIRFMGKYHRDWDEERTNPLLIQVIEELGERANNRFSKLEIVEIPDDVKWQIDEYDGWESIHEVHREW